MSSSRRYSLPSLKSGFGFSKKKSSQVVNSGDHHHHHHHGPSSLFFNSSSSSSAHRHHDKFLRSTGSSSPSSPLNSGDARLHHLKRVMQAIHPGHCRLLPGHNQLYRIFGNRRVDRLNSKIDCDEVYPNVMIGNEGAAKNKAYLKLIGVTHVLNCAEGVHFCQINTGSYYYSDHNMKYMGLNIMDVPQAKISIHFQETADFIERALMGGGKVLVHCMVGLSRSATIAIAYLMIKRGLSLEEALRTIRRHREIRPNDGFLQQLIELEYNLSTSSNYGVQSLPLNKDDGFITSLTEIDSTPTAFMTGRPVGNSSSLFYPSATTYSSRFYSQGSLR